MDILSSWYMCNYRQCCQSSSSAIMFWSSILNKLYNHQIHCLHVIYLAVIGYRVMCRNVCLLMIINIFGMLKFCSSIGNYPNFGQFNNFFSLIRHFVCTEPEAKTSMSKVSCRFKDKVLIVCIFQYFCCYHLFIHSFNAKLWH